MADGTGRQKPTRSTSNRWPHSSPSTPRRSTGSGGPSPSRPTCGRPAGSAPGPGSTHSPSASGRALPGTTSSFPQEQLDLLHEIGDQVAHRNTVYDNWGFGERITRGLGISALFAGVSGGGKTLAAEVLANELDLDLYRVDLSAVVSKYIGETEKNLRRLFDAAESGSVILFFDEADALFGKRTEVKDSHDRYANIESSYLLQRMEAYGGLSILATNMRHSLDAAFMRRIRFVVEFPFPERDERKLLWQKAFPDNAPTKRLDFDRLAELRVTGGMARNIALNAAFRAASSDQSISMPAVLDAARTEYQKLELPVRSQDFAHGRRTRP